MKLAQIPKDKSNHFSYGFVIYFIASLLFNPYLSLGIVLVFALAKECYDEHSYAGFDLKDFAVTVIPAVLLVLKNLIK